uniref:Uncharacterized protein n=1 Tax=Glossina morsitans morsitans TaxID=37546 RepID=A0A1B0F9L1_GLOMM
MEIQTATSLSNTLEIKKSNGKQKLDEELNRMRQHIVDERRRRNAAGATMVVARNAADTTMGVTRNAAGATMGVVRNAAGARIHVKNNKK